MYWKDAEDIAIALVEAHPEVDPLTVRFTDLHRFVVALSEFDDDPKASNEGKLEAIHPGPRTTVNNPDHKVYPYLLRGVAIERRDQVWSSDITYIPMHQGFMYLSAVIDWYSRYVLSWSLSNSLDGRSCLESLEEALRGRSVKRRRCPSRRGLCG